MTVVEIQVGLLGEKRCKSGIWHSIKSEEPLIATNC
jgi:hypothetical protein